jgi:hypothetical protein
MGRLLAEKDNKRVMQSGSMVTVICLVLRDMHIMLIIHLFIQFPSKMPEDFEIAKVLYFFCYNVQEDTPMPLAMASVFGVLDRVLLKESSAVMWAVYPGLGGV